MASIERIVVVAGCQRSGSTLVGQIIGAHPDALLLDEPDGLYGWFDAYARNSRDAADRLRSVLIKANAKYRRGHRRIAPHGSGADPAIRRNVTHLVLKAPNLSFRYEELSRLPLPVSAVFPVRDPRAVVASMMRLIHIPMVQNQIRLLRRHEGLAAALRDEIAILEDETRSPEARCALVWRIKSLMHERFASHRLPVLTVRYEDLVSNAAEICWRIADHVGLSRHRQMLAHEEVFQGVAPGLTERSRPVDRRSLDTWRERLSSAQQEEILAVAGDAMSRLGFGPAQAPAGRRRPPAIATDALRSPVILTGRGGSGTRLIAEMAQQAGLFLGNRLNVSRDSLEWVDLIYEMGIERALSDFGTPTGPAPGRDDTLLENARNILGSGGWRQSTPWGWKLPETMLVIPELLAVFSGARLVHLVRHPVDCSLRRTHLTSRPDNPIGNAVLRAAYRSAGLDPALIGSHGDHIRNALSWRYQVHRAMTFGRRHLAPGQYLEIRYEDLCADPDAARGRLLAFIGLSGGGEQSPVIDPDRMRSYSLPDARAAEVWEICGETALQLGYKPIA